MEPTQGSETSAYQNLTPGKYPKEYTQYSTHGESLKSSKLEKYYNLNKFKNYGNNVITIISRKTQQCHKWLYLDLSQHVSAYQSHHQANMRSKQSSWPHKIYKPKHVAINLDIAIYDTVVFYD
jgi:hypothetical protein